MPEWIPTRNSAKGRLVLAALEAFAARGYEDVNVVSLAEAAGVTTGSLYHHFGSKLGLYETVRADIERRVLDRLAGAIAAREGDSPESAAHAGLLVAFDYLTQEGYARLLAEPHPGGGVDPITTFVTDVVDRGQVPVGRLLVAAWRAALQVATEGMPPRRARAAFVAIGPRAPS